MCLVAIIVTCSTKRDFITGVIWRLWLGGGRRPWCVMADGWCALWLGVVLGVVVGGGVIYLTTLKVLLFQNIINTSKNPLKYVEEDFPPKYLPPV